MRPAVDLPQPDSPTTPRVSPGSKRRTRCRRRPSRDHPPARTRPPVGDREVLLEPVDLHSTAPRWTGPGLPGAGPPTPGSASPAGSVGASACGPARAPRRCSDRPDAGLVDLGPLLAGRCGTGRGCREGRGSELRLLGPAAVARARSSVNRHRGWNMQPAGRRIRDGGLPGIGVQPRAAECGRSAAST